MAMLAIWLVICLVLAIVFASRPLYLLILSAVIRILIPNYVSNAWMPGFHLAGYLIVITFIIQVVFYWPRVRRYIFSSKLEIFGISSFFLLMLVNSASIHNSLRNIILNILIVYLPPLLLYLMLKNEIISKGFIAVRRISFCVHLLMMYEVWLAVKQDEAGEILYFSDYRVGSSWAATSAEIGRSMGTLESGLEFTALCSFAIALTFFIKNSFIRIFFIMLYLYAALLGTGRASLAVGILTGIIVVLLSRDIILFKISNLIIGFLGICFLLTTEAGSDILSKIENDEGSTAKRVEALNWVKNNYSQFTLTGYPGEHDLRTSGQLASSLENAYLTVGLEYGLLAAGVLLFVQVIIILKNIRNKNGFVMAFAPLGVIATNMTNTGFTTNSVSAYLIWFALALTSIGLYKARNILHTKEKSSVVCA